jgi:phospholipase/lecithinase/hemolysin
MLGQSTTAQQEEAYVESEYNSLLASRLATFMSANSGVTGKVIDTQTAFKTALNNPTAYGATDAKCYNSDGKTCLWFNDYHPGMAIHKLVAQAVQTAFKGSFF